MASQVLMRTRIGNKEMISASRSLANTRNGPEYRLKEIELSDRDLDLLASKIEPLAPMDKLKLKYFQEKEQDFGQITPLFKDRGISYIFAEAPGAPLSVAFDSHGLIKTNIILNRDLLAKQIIKIAEKVGVSDDAFNYNKRSGNMIASAINGSILGVRILGAETQLRKLVYPKLSRHALAYLLLLISKKSNIMIVGPRGSGKTELAWALAKHINKIVTIEEFPKIVLGSDRWIPLLKPKNYGVSKLIIAASRLKPEYILIDELRGTETAVVLNKKIGPSFISTIAMDNFEHLVDVFTGKHFGLPKSALANIDVLVNVGFGHVGRKRTALVKEIVEISGFDFYKNKLAVNTVFKWDGKQLKAFRSKLPAPTKDKLDMLLGIAHSILG